MIRFPGRIPVSIYPTFWIFAALIGYINSQSFIGTLIWIGIIFISVLIHEYGHALTALLFGQKPRIELVALGGLTYHDGQQLSFLKQFFIVLDGPLFGFMLYVVSALLLQIPSLAQGMSGSILSLISVVNLFWTIVNLLPVFPLDGGQLLRIILERIFGFKGFKYALYTSVVVAILISLGFFLYQAFIIGALFFLLAFQSFDTLRRTKHLTASDRDDSLRDLLLKIEEKMQAGHKEEAIELCNKARAKAKEGMLHAMATQYLALMKYDAGESKEAYELLRSVRDDLAGDTLCLLHKAAYDQKDFALVAELGPTCFQTWPTVDTALRNAVAHAELKQATPAVGWLQTAVQEGLENINQVLAEKFFDSIRADPIFQEFIQAMKKGN